MYESNKFSRVYHLKQVTPMWHFQSYEKGCCLCASEVKPKLDKFLSKKGLMFNGNGNVDQKSFDYKLSFVAPDENPVLDNFKSPLFFGNTRNKNDDSRNDKQAVFYKNEIIVKIFSFNNLVLNEIDKNIREFFLTTSFGTRQDKGFGCFVISDSTSDTRSDSTILEEVASYVFKVQLAETSVADKNDWEERTFYKLFNYILYFHKMIRSGINEPKYKKEGKEYVLDEYGKKVLDEKRTFYYKSFMYHYAKSLGETWDKPVIRHNFELFNDKYKRICVSRNINEERYKSSKILFRDALGLATDQSWTKYKSMDSDRKFRVDQIKIRGQKRIGNSDGYDSVDRFKSPILYRPYLNLENSVNKVYLILDQDSLEKFKEDSSFVVSKEPDKDCYAKKTYSPLSDMIIYKDFNLENYLDFVKDYCDKVRKEGGRLSGKDNVNYIIESIFGRGGTFEKIDKRQKKDGE